MNNRSPPKVSIGAKLTDEFKEFAIIAAYLYVCFAALLYFKASILKAQTRANINLSRRWNLILGGVKC
jgi:hypothetical protein